MEVREHRPDGAFGHVDHPLLFKQVRDPQTDRTGQLRAVVRESAGKVSGRAKYTRTAYIRAADGREFTAAPDKLERA
ncbi:hypothetical protein [Streptomyces sp. H27-H5]|uniref:hypothetical protein n=1 Tax=Streptomyces sp. H27-H5 TaxID=2996460 RepID=UPI002270C288|nr:hypothetical protein [Streptomyces sp. H27-H5]MCY0961533.1 hypothetical protein [Streptomyces sp. H27-H5]